MFSNLRIVFSVAACAAPWTSIVSAGTQQCVYDLIENGIVNAADLADLLDNWGPNPGYQGDFNCNGVINASDLADLLDHWGPCQPSPLNDYCCGAIAITNGNTSFSTLQATTDGPLTPFCDFKFGEDQLEIDVWYNYTATCTGDLVVTTCNQANFDTRLASYSGCSCPVSPASAVGCNDDDAASSCGADPLYHSTMIAPVVLDSCYKIRVGGFKGDSGTGTLSVFCVESGPCGPGAGDCCIPHGTPGCVDVACCQSVCAMDAFCCDIQWDNLCVVRAQSVPECNCAASDCCVAHPYAGCDDPECQSIVCSDDVFCCIAEWDGLCAQSALKLCTVCQ